MTDGDKLDRRLHAYRDDLADSRLEGRISAKRFVEGKESKVVSRFADVLDKPADDAGLQAQFLKGQKVRVFERIGGWAWVQGEDDSYVGYVREDALGSDAQAEDHSDTHMVSSPRTFLYSGPDLKKPRCGFLSMGSTIRIVGEATTRGTRYMLLDTGEAAIANHLIKPGEGPDDPVSVAETLLHTPYLWGGNTGFGVDCSGMISLANRVCGKVVPRDSDMQAASLGQEIEADFSNLKRGDLVFWKGHVGMMADRKNMLHANGHTMNVAVEPLDEAIERISYLYSKPTLVRRPD